MPKRIEPEKLSSIGGKTTDAGWSRFLERQIRIRELATSLRKVKDITREVMESPVMLGDHTSGKPLTRKGNRMPTPIKAKIVKRPIVGRGRKAIFAESPDWAIHDIGGMIDVTSDVAGKLKGLTIESLLTYSRTKDAEKEYQRLASAVKRVVRASTGNELASFTLSLAENDEGSMVLVCSRGEDRTPDAPESPADLAEKESAAIAELESDEQREGESDDDYLARLDSEKDPAE